MALVDCMTMSMLVFLAAPFSSSPVLQSDMIKAYQQPSQFGSEEDAL